MSYLKARIGCLIAQLITSTRLQALRRTAFSAARKLTGRTATVHYFHQHDDPYSQLLASCLPALQARYRIAVVAHAVPAPDAAAAPDLQRLNDWSVRDAERLRSSLPAVARSPAPPVSIKSPTPAELLRGGALRKKMGHYLGAMLYFEGEWYWGTDRLHYLEQRLTEAGLRLQAPASPSTLESHAGPLIPPRGLQLKPVAALRPTSTLPPPVIHFYCSLRSPYTHLAARQVRQLAQHYRAELRIRYVLPMVMRGLPVPLAKRLYILRDTQREAVRLGIPFGAVVDPVGAPVEAGLALLQAACEQRQGSALLESFLSAAFAEGIDAGSPQGLQQIARRGGIGAPEMRAALKDTRWREIAEANRADMLERGLWGVPSFRVNDQPALWGQDRLWMLEEDLLQALEAASI
ncbi:MAG: hypothetical protein CFE43_00345 [Burkholderiales bacterium PBB3]|nr:MAG: hypothetical protein CFE43_00345 [Burkholderiales bacterium PBB3]